MNSDAQIFIDDADRHDIEQGFLENCWLVAAISSIANYPALFDHVIPNDQNMQDPNYAGTFRARFWRFGQWIETSVDDRLPVQKNTSILVFSRSPNTKEYWSALLEKAYAKLHTCYANLSFGMQAEAMEDLTGGVVEIIDISPDRRPDDLLQRMIAYADRCCLMGCMIKPGTFGDHVKNGLVEGHAYSVTAVKPVTVDGQRRYLVRCRNPWGSFFEWTGAWSDQSSEWNKVNKNQKKNLDVEFHDDGEFWMSFEDFVSYFAMMEVCHLGLESLEHNQDFRGRRRLQESIFSGSWEKGLSAGGCVVNKDTFATNPQFCFTITDPDPNDDENKCLVIIAVMQKGIRSQRGCEFLSIGFGLYEVKNGHTGLLTKEQLSDKPSLCEPLFEPCREVVQRVRLSPGTYVVIPSTYDKDEEAQFIVRIFAQVAIADRELDEDNRFNEPEIPAQEGGFLQAAFQNSDREIEQRFKELADPSTGTIRAKELAHLLNDSSLKFEIGFTGFGKEFCRSLLASVDLNITGQMDFSEFMDLWFRIKGLEDIFHVYDTESTGMIKAENFRKALSDAGFTVSNKVFSALARHYGDFDSKSVDFSDFILCATRLRSVFETAKAQTKGPDGSIMFTKEDYLRLSIYI
ncbi:unnamed protein product [Calicophoron daubneyi]|uniref:Uncharacterized protein n=1 Tax=Calicophoron daubneyi TaxID=300641 RepID=A0AAV2TZX3_CALDB